MAKRQTWGSECSIPHCLHVRASYHFKTMRHTVQQQGTCTDKRLKQANWTDKHNEHLPNAKRIRGSCFFCGAGWDNKGQNRWLQKMFEHRLGFFLWKILRMLLSCCCTVIPVHAASRRRLLNESFERRALSEESARKAGERLGTDSYRGSPRSLFHTFSTSWWMEVDGLTVWCHTSQWWFSTFVVPHLHSSHVRWSPSAS